MVNIVIMIIQCNIKPRDFVYAGKCENCFIIQIDQENHRMKKFTDLRDTYIEITAL